MWIEIFKTGHRVDSKGRAKWWTIEDLDRVVNKYDPAWHEAPIVIGPLKDTSPAYGWIKSLKREGEILLGQVKDTVPELLKRIRDNLFEKRTVSFYPDFGLRHVGFLGIEAPILNLPSKINFKEGGIEMSFYYEKKDDPGMELHKKVMDLLNSPPHFDFCGRPIDREKITYNEAFNLVCQENPELAQQYVEQIRGHRKG